MNKILILTLVLLPLLTALAFAAADPKKSDAVIVTTEFLPGPAK